MGRFAVAQSRELQFWKGWCQSVRVNFKDPADYVKHRIADTLSVRGLTADDFKGKSVIEYGSGMYPMCSVLPAAQKRIVEPLFYEFKNMLTPQEIRLLRGIVISSQRGEEYQTDKHFDYCILKNILDHTTNPQGIVDNINADVILVDSFVGRNENLEIHPSAFKTVDEIKDLFHGYECTLDTCDERLKNHYLTFERA